MPEDIRDLIARSSLGGAAWCSNCDHPVDLHEEWGCDGLAASGGLCECQGFVAQTPDEWKRRHG